jgi:hypothetical protein
VAGKGAKGAKQQGKKGAGGGNKAAVAAAAVAAAGKGKKESGKGAKPEVVKKLTSAEMDDALDSYWVKVILHVSECPFFLSLQCLSSLLSLCVGTFFFALFFPSYVSVGTIHSLTTTRTTTTATATTTTLTHPLTHSPPLPLPRHRQAGPKGMDTLLDRYMSERPKTAPAADGAAAAAAPAPDAVK